MTDQNVNPNPESPNEDPVIGDAPPSSNVLLSNKVYDVLKWVCVIFLPALATLYMALAGQWESWPEPEKVVATIVAVDTFLGLLLGLSTRQYNRNDAAFDGHIDLSSNQAAGVTDARFRIDPAALESGKKQVRLKVRQH